MCGSSRKTGGLKKSFNLKEVMLKVSLGDRGLFHKGHRKKEDPREMEQKTLAITGIPTMSGEPSRNFQLTSYSMSLT